MHNAGEREPHHIREASRRAATQSRPPQPAAGSSPIRLSQRSRLLAEQTATPDAGRPSPSEGDRPASAQSGRPTRMQ